VAPVVAPNGSKAILLGATKMTFRHERTQSARPKEGEIAACVGRRLASQRSRGT
jgi:hypothetical protein